MIVGCREVSAASMSAASSIHNRARPARPLATPGPNRAGEPAAPPGRKKTADQATATEPQPEGPLARTTAPTVAAPVVASVRSHPEVKSVARRPGSHGDQVPFPLPPFPSNVPPRVIRFVDGFRFRWPRSDTSFVVFSRLVPTHLCLPASGFSSAFTPDLTATATWPVRFACGLVKPTGPSIFIWMIGAAAPWGRPASSFHRSRAPCG